MGCEICAWWRKWFPMESMAGEQPPEHDCFYKRCDR